MMMPAAPSPRRWIAAAPAAVAILREPAFPPMPAGVGEPQRVVQRVRVAVEGLGAGWIRDQRVGLGEAANERIVPAGAVEV